MKEDKSTEKVVYTLDGNNINPLHIDKTWLYDFNFYDGGKIGSFIKTPSFTVEGYGFLIHTQKPFSNDGLFSEYIECYYLGERLYVEGGLMYIHTLQNLYLDLTKEELPLKES